MSSSFKLGSSIGYVAGIEVVGLMGYIKTSRYFSSFIASNSNAIGTLAKRPALKNNGHKIE